jgi:hypothetical protein
VRDGFKYVKGFQILENISFFFFFFFVGATYLKDQHILDSENLPSFRGQLEPLEHLFFNLTKCRQPSKFKPKSILRC